MRSRTDSIPPRESASAGDADACVAQPGIYAVTARKRQPLDREAFSF
jgi:hypothetical protein